MNTNNFLAKIVCYYDHYQLQFGWTCLFRPKY